MNDGQTPEEGNVICSNVSSGRLAIDGLFYGFRRMSQLEAPGKTGTGVLDPLASAGLRDALEQNDLKGVNAPVTDGGGFGLTAEGLEESISFIEQAGDHPLFAYTIVPSNPSGERTPNEKLLELALKCYEKRVSLVIDVFYLAISPEGLGNSPIPYLRQNLPPEAWANVVIIEGDTKAVGFPRTSSVMMSVDPRGPALRVDGKTITKNNFLADQFQRRKAAVNSYPDPTSALGSFALHTYPNGIHEAMGPRYAMLESSRGLFRERVAQIVPVVGDNTLYSAVALVDENGDSLVKDRDGRPVTDTETVGKRLLLDYQLAIAPMALFRDGAPGTLVRATAATTTENVQRFIGILERLRSS